MKAKVAIRNLLILSIVAMNVACDQLSKNIIRNEIDINEKIVVINNFLTLTKVENTGAFLSLGNHLPRISYQIIMIALPLIFIGYALFYLFKNITLSKLLTFGICLGIGGGLGNILDRIIFGSVTDFLHFDFVIFHTGIVNMADISITCGFIIITYSLIKMGKLKSQTH